MKLRLFGVGLIASLSALGQWAFEGPIPPITSGYGSYGPDSSNVQFFTIPADTDTSFECAQDIRGLLFTPASGTGPFPTVFYLPGSSVSEAYLQDSGFYWTVERYGHLLASNGYAMAALRWPTDMYNSHGCGYYFTEAAVDYFPTLIDTTRIGFKGMSQGGTVSNWLALKRFINSGWGSNGRFVQPDAYWGPIGWIRDFPADQQSYTDSALAAMPDDVLYLPTVSELDNLHDIRVHIDLYTFMGVPDSNKAFYIIRGDTVNSYIYWATHETERTYVEDTSSLNFFTYMTKYDALDYWAFFRPLMALCATAWEGDTAARRICMGNGEAIQVQMAQGQLKDLLVTDDPKPEMHWVWNNGTYANPCTVAWNMRQYVTADACFLLSIPEEDTWDYRPMAFPNPASARQWITLNAERADLKELHVYDTQGREVPFDKAGSSIQLRQEGYYILKCLWSNGHISQHRIVISPAP